MRQWFAVIVALFAFSHVRADVESYAPVLSAKVSVYEPNGYFQLSDGTHWKVIGFVPRTRGLGEWWNNVQLAPDTYKCLPKDWVVGAQIIAYPKYGNLGVEESNAINHEALKQCSHLLVNQGNAQVLFALPLDPATWLVQLFNDAHRFGYDSGYNKGFYERSYVTEDEKKKQYDQGYSKGYSDRSLSLNTESEKKYKQGYDDGYAKCYNDVARLGDNKNNKSYTDGYALGASERAEVAKEENRKKYQEGYDAGYAKGLNDGLNDLAK